LHRYLSSLHVPYFGLSLHETAYAFSRKVVVDTALRIWCAAYPSSSILAGQQRGDPDREDLARLAFCGFGFSRTVVMQATVLIAVELKAQLQDEQSLGPALLRPDLLSVLEDAKIWSLRCIDAGETNIKGYLLTSILGAQVQGLIQGVGKDKIPELLVKAGEAVVEKCLPMLQEMAANLDGLHQMSLNTPPDVSEDWDFMVSKEYALDFCC